MQTRQELNAEFHQKLIELNEYVVENELSDPEGDELREELTKEYVLKFRELKAAIILARKIARGQV